MNVPKPRRAADTIDDRDHYLAACAHIWDHAREASRAQMIHGATMILTKLGGSLILRAQSVPAKRTLPEAGYISEGAVGLGGLL